VLNARTSREQTALVPVTVHMRDYTDAQIERYLRADEPYDCAGSARIEGLGIALVARLEGDDPNALIGLPLIALCNMLRNEGWELP
jgi:septum formation protein